MRQYLLIVLSVLIPTILFSQDFEPPEMRFGKDIEENLKTETWDIVEEDEAIILFSKGNYSFKVIGEDLGLIGEYHYRYKVLNNKGSEFANIKLIENSYFDEKINNIKAISYNNSNGKIEETKLSKKDLFVNKLDEYITEYTFAIPNVKEGTVFEYSYTVNKPNQYRPNKWYFNDKIPVLYSEIEFNIPEWFQYQEHHKGLEPYVIRNSENSKNNLGASYESVDSKIYTLAKANMPAFKTEAYVSNINDYREQHQYRLESVRFPNSIPTSYVRSWQGINNSLLQNQYEELFQEKKYINELVEELTQGLDSETDIVSALYNYVIDNIEVKYDGWLFQSMNQKQLLKSKEGNLADANILLVNLLQTAGIEAYPILISNRDDGYIDSTNPDPAAFSYPVVWANVEDQELLLNASTKERPYNLARYNDYNLNAWKLSPDGGEWIKTESLCPTSSRLINIEATLAENGSLRGAVTATSNGYYNIEDKTLATDASVEEILNRIFSTQNDKIKFENTKKLADQINDNQFGYGADFVIEEYAYKIGDFLYFNPTLIGRVEENPFKNEQRNYPVDIPFPSATVVKLKINYPDGYDVEETPKPIQFKMTDKTKAVIVYQSEGSALTGTVVFKREDTFFQPSSYPILKNYTDKLIEETSKQITLIKK